MRIGMVIDCDAFCLFDPSFFGKKLRFSLHSSKDDDHYHERRKQWKRSMDMMLRRRTDEGW